MGHLPGTNLKAASIEARTVARGAPVRASRITSRARDRDAARRAQQVWADRRVGNWSVLETAQLKSQTHADYTRRRQEFVEWCDLERRNWTSDEHWDQILVDFFDLKYTEGAPSDDGEKTLAALQFACPRFARRGGAKLPRTGRALKS